MASTHLRVHMEGSATLGPAPPLVGREGRGVVGKWTLGNFLNNRYHLFPLFHQAPSVQGRRATQASSSSPFQLVLIKGGFFGWA